MLCLSQESVRGVALLLQLCLETFLLLSDIGQLNC